MKHLNCSIIILALCSLFIQSGCYTNQNTTQTAANVQTPIAPQAAENNSNVVLKDTDIQEFASRVQWPEFDLSTAQAPVFTIDSGVNDGVWVEAKGYFHIPLDQIFQDLTDVQVMGPTYLTNDIVQKDLVNNQVLTTYTMDIKMRYIMSVEFSIGVRIEAFYDAQGQLKGYVYQSNKSDGTRFITRIDESLVVRQLENNWFSVEFQSLNVATMNKEEETRKHIESLFDRWNRLSLEGNHAEVPEITTENSN